MMMSTRICLSPPLNNPALAHKNNNKKNMSTKIQKEKRIRSNEGKNIRDHNRTLKMSIATPQQQFHASAHQFSHHHRNNAIMDASIAANLSQSANVNNVQCGPCLNRFLEFRNQAINRMTLEYQKIWTGQGIPAIDGLNHIVYQSLRLGDNELAGTVGGKCLYCDTHIESLKKGALEVVNTRVNPFLRNMLPYNQETNVDHQYLMDRNMATRGETTDSINGFKVPGLNNTVGNGRDVTIHQYTNLHPQESVKNHHNPSSSSSSTTSSRTLNSQQFFNEVAKKCVKQKRSSSSNKQKSKDTPFPTNFSQMLKQSPPPNPPGLFKYMNRRVDGKVSVMLRVQQTNDQSDSLIEIDQRKYQVSFLPPPSSNAIPDAQAPPSQPKLFAFDNVFEPEVRQDRISAGSLLDVLHAVINGGDGAVVTYGGPGTGKTQTMIGQDDSKLTAGIIPCAIAWLYSLIDGYKQRTGARISIRVSAIEVSGKNEDLKDLLAGQATGTDGIDSHTSSPGIYLSDDTSGGVSLDNVGDVSEPQAVDAEKAGFYLDAALASRTSEKDESGNKTQKSHMIFTFHIYQYRVDKNARRFPQGSVPYSGGRSRLHLIDLSYVNQNFDEKNASNQAPSHAALGQILITMLNGNKRVTLFKDSKIARLLRDSIGNLTCRSILIAHVSSEEKNYRKTLQTLNITQKIQRKRRKRNKNYNSSSDNNSCDEGKQKYRVQHPLISTRAIEDNNPCSDYNTSSAGEDSCDTVIYMGSNGHISDRDLTDNERPPSPTTMKIMKMKLSSSEDENTDTGDSLTPSKRSTDDLRMKLSTLEEREEKCAPLVSRKPSVGERVVNVVAPLVVKESPPKEFTTSSIVEDLKINRSETSSDVILPPSQDKTSSKSVISLESNISEKYLRSHEKRIEQILATNFDLALSDDEGLVDNHNKRNRLNDGYASDVAVSTPRCRQRSSTRDGYISAPEYSKPVQIVKGTVRKQQSLDETQSKNENVKNSNNDNGEKETCLDDIGNDIKTSTPKQTDLSGKNKKERLEILPLSVGRFSSIREASEPQIAPQMEIPEPVVETPEPQVEETSIESIPITSSNQDETDFHEKSSGKIKNLNHIITVSPIPNFSVTKKPPLSQLPSSPTLPLHQNISRDTIERTCSPRFERSYSREDTISVVSAYESDAYDSDAFVASPALNASRSQRNPTRLRYRWSTVYEEPEDKKSEKSKQKKTVVDSEPKPSRVIMSPKSSSKHSHSSSSSKSSLTSKFTKSPKNDKKSSETQKSSKKHLSSTKSEPPMSPKNKSRFNLLSPRTERKNKKTPNYSPDKRMSGCSDASSGLDSGIHSQTSSLRSGEDIQVDDRTIVREEVRSSKSKLWPFGRSKSRKSTRSLSGYVSDGHITESSRSRRSRFFGSRSSKSSLNTEGYCSGYETSVTEGGMTSCNEDHTDTESVSGKKKRRFLGFRRRSTNDLSSTRGRVKKPMWFDKRGCQSDTEDLHLKVYQIDDPNEINKRRAKSENVMSHRTSSISSTSSLSSKKIEGLRKQNDQLKSELRSTLDLFPATRHKSTANLSSSRTSSRTEPVGYMKYMPVSSHEERKYAQNLERENAEMGRKLKHVRNHIQVVTCFDGSSRKVTQI